MYAIYKIDEKSRKMRIGRAKTVKKCVEMISDYIDTHNMGVIYETPKKAYVHRVGDIGEQIASGKVRVYQFNPSYPEWYGKKMRGCQITCEVGDMYAYHRRGLTTEVHFEDNCDVVHLSNNGRITFCWEEV